MHSCKSGQPKFIMKPESLEQFQARAAKCGIQLDAVQLAGISTFCSLLSACNERINLVSRSDLDFLLFEHVLDSLPLIPLISKLRSGKYASLIDIGSGAGFPGLVLAMLCSELSVTLVEATAKKCAFLNEAVAALKLDQQVRVINARAEDLGRDRKYRDSFQFATARAVGSIEIITELAIPLLQEAGYLLAQKSAAQIEAELASSEKFFAAVGAVLKQTATINREVLDKEHVVLVIQKIAPTPSKFPRPFSKISKRKL
jgi:16S rRNA (guanine527-N7)-methyltransferase